MIGAPAGSRAVVDITAAGALARDMEGVVIDARNRAWAHTDQGLLRIDEDGTVTEYISGTVGLPEAKITALAVVAGGPTLTATAVRQAVSGRILQDGAPLAEHDVVLCDTSSLLFTTHPCEDGSVRFEARTDSEGRFAFPEIPQADYHFLVKQEKWTAVLGAGCCASMRPSAPLVLEDITLQSE